MKNNSLQFFFNGMKVCSIHYLFLQSYYVYWSKLMSIVLPQKYLTCHYGFISTNVYVVNTKKRRKKKGNQVFKFILIEVNAGLIRLGTFSAFSLCYCTQVPPVTMQKFAQCNDFWVLKIIFAQCFEWWHCRYHVFCPCSISPVYWRLRLVNTLVRECVVFHQQPNKFTSAT